jgi:hypothetical protein
MSPTHNVARVAAGHALAPVPDVEAEADLEPPPSTKRFTAAGLTSALTLATRTVHDEPTLTVGAEDNRRLLEAAFGRRATRPLLEPDLERALAAACAAHGIRPTATATATTARGGALDPTHLVIGSLWAMMVAVVSFTIYVVANAG